MPQILSMEGKGNERVGRQSMFSSFGNWFSSLHKFDKFFIIAALLIVVATPFIVSNNQNFNPEAKGPRGGCHGKNCPPTYTATLSFFQNGVQVTSVPAQTPFDVRGSGYAPNITVLIGPKAWIPVEVATDGSGNFSYTWNGLYPGSYPWVAGVRGSDGMITVLATAYLTVY